MAPRRGRDREAHCAREQMVGRATAGYARRQVGQGLRFRGTGTGRRCVGDDGGVLGTQQGELAREAVNNGLLFFLKLGMELGGSQRAGMAQRTGTASVLDRHRGGRGREERRRQ